jgi:hypothetical protein
MGISGFAKPEFFIRETVLFIVKKNIRKPRLSTAGIATFLPAGCYILSSLIIVQYPYCSVQCCTMRPKEAGSGEGLANGQ